MLREISNGKGEQSRVKENGRRPRWMETTRREGGTDHMMCSPSRKELKGKKKKCNILSVVSSSSISSRI